MKPIKYPQREWRKEWRDRLVAGCVVRIKDSFGSQIELRSFPLPDKAHAFIAALPADLRGEIVTES